jgi:WS/DGAT/MGAT family acyltransferase
MAFERLSAQDTSFLHIETPVQPQHVGSVALFEAAPFFHPSGRFRLEDARRAVASRLHLVPRFRKRIMTVPFDQGRPVWVDDEHFDLTYHVRLTALPRPGTDEQLKALVGRLQSQALDRRRPLWELWFVEGLAEDRVAIIQKTHHCLVDGISGVDVATVLLDLEPDPPHVDAPDWEPEPAPTPPELLVESLIERVTEPAEIARSARATLRGPKAAIERAAAVSRTLTTAAQTAPRAPWNVPISPHRRWETARVPLAQAKAIKDAAGTSLNDVVLAAVAGALRGFLEGREEPVDGLVLKAMIPVSVRDDSERMALGNRVSMMSADLPIGEPDALERLRLVHEHMEGVKASGEAVGADTLIQMTNYMPPTMLSLTARLIVRQRAVNLTITNIPGPQFPLYCQGARMLEAFPYVGIVDNQALTIAVLSYDGKLGFGITGDRDVLPDLRVIAEGIEAEFAALAARQAPTTKKKARAKR